LKLLKGFNTTTNTSIFSEIISEDIYNVKFKTYQYLIQSNLINKLTNFSAFDSPSLLGKCICRGVLMHKKLNFIMVNETLDSLKNEYYVEDLEGICGEEIIVPVTYESTFSNLNQVNF
jgi:hypothetical protein